MFCDIHHVSYVVIDGKLVCPVCFIEDDEEIIRLKFKFPEDNRKDD